MKVSFTPQARRDLPSIRDWIAEYDDRAADRVLSRIRQTAMLLGQFPMIGRTGSVEDTREFSVTGLPYLIVYQVAPKDELDILTIIHTRQKYPPDTDPG